MAEGAQQPSPRAALHGTINAGGHPYPRHVCVTVTGITPDQHPGILLDWRRDPAGRWEALVMWAAGGGRHTAHARIDWLSADHVEPR